MKLLWQLARRSWKQLGLAALLGGLSGGTNVALLAIIHRSLRQADAGSLKLAGIFAAFCLVSLLTRVIAQTFLVRLMHQSISQIRMDLIQKILRSPLRQLEEIGVNRMLGALTGDVGVISHALNNVPMLCVNVVILLFGAGYLATLSIPVLIAAIIFTVLGGLSYWLIARQSYPYFGKSREQSDTMLGHVRSLITGVKEMKLHSRRRDTFINDVLLPEEAAARRTQLISAVIQDIASSWGRLLFMIAIGLLLFAWPRIQSLDAGTITGYTLAIFYLMSPLERIVSMIPLLVRAGISIDRLQRIGLMLDDLKTEPTTESTFDSWACVELVGVTHTYHREGHDEGFQLGPIDLTIRRGELLFIVGGNGSGKTTLAKLITGLYVPESGEIRLEGVTIGDPEREAYRQLFTAVFDDSTIFSGLWGLERHDLDGRAAEYLRALRLDHVVKVSDGQFSTTTELSAGQRKRLSLLTAYLEDRPIYLFDEWAANQDPVFKETFYHEILPDLRGQGKAVIVITHDDRFFSVANRVVKLEDGRILYDAEPEPSAAAITHLP
jgi:putative ATP-binding cassette transporter